MSNLWVKRIGLAIICLALGYGLTFGIVRLFLDTTMSDYGFVYSFFTTLSIACGIGIWLDKFMGTQILPK